ncbi:MAG: hypothetical protein ACR2LQ_08685 [Acidimicrobiales bacterium]
MTAPAAGCESVGSNTCVVVDAANPGAPTTGVGLGSLHGITASTDPARVTPLEPTAWRLSALDFPRFALAHRYGGAITVILSDPWVTATHNLAPWSNWDFYRYWVDLVVQAHIGQGALPDYWEIQNEPSAETYTGAEPATADLVFQQHQVAAEVIRQRLPAAKILGPAPGYPNFGFGLADVSGFVQRADSTGLHPAGVSWHEIGAGCLGYCDGNPRAVLQHADDVRAVLAAHPALAGVKLVVDEWGAPWSARQPGSVAGYLSSLASAGIDIANPACFALDGTDGVSRLSCFAVPGTLDGLVLDDGTTPTDAWFVHRAYAQMTGPSARLLSSTIADPEASSIATIDATDTIRVLLGRHTGCQVGVDDNCPVGFSYAAPTSVRALITVGSTSTRYLTSVERIASTAGASSGPTQLGQPRLLTAPSKRGAATIDVGALTLNDGEAVVITMVPVR